MVLAAGSPFGIIVCHREVKVPGSADVLGVGLWDPGCRGSMEPWCWKGRAGGRLQSWVAWGDLPVPQEGEWCGAESFCQ